MSTWDNLLPTSVEVGGQEYKIRSDFRAILDIFCVLNDPELDEQERAYATLDIFYPDFEHMPQEHMQEAINRCMEFIEGDGPKSTNKKQPKMVDWEQDFPLIVAPINRVMGCEIRAAEYIHYYTFIAAYQEIGECTFSQVVSIRNKLARGKKLDKQDQEWYRRNRHLVDLERKYTQADDEVLGKWF